VFSPLPVATVETLAARSETEEREARDEILRQGDEGDRFFVVEEGTVEVTADGRVLRRSGTGERFGEERLEASRYDREDA
jgi:CRP-like cAMP-binding protein